ncbi:TetR/AcrR family transcriptional regulator [Streptomyces sp. 6N223]|uniref:TetR/AcrR family transcriptional regulator n=1 Tax=Streptomyces sp. 6N223 TaxID=3457412 RepID=UPI003FD154E6
MSAEERRESVLRAAITEFARGGYAGTSTAAIARRVGVSQPYLFRLFPDKRAIFLAAARRCTEEVRRGFESAAEGLDPQGAYEAMCRAYTDLIADRDRLMLQMQMCVAVHVAEEAGDREFGEEIREAWAGMWDSVRLMLGADEGLVGSFFGNGMFINTALALGFPEGHRVWTTCDIFNMDDGKGG